MFITNLNGKINHEEKKSKMKQFPNVTVNITIQQQ